MSDLYIELCEENGQQKIALCDCVEHEGLAIKLTDGCLDADGCLVKTYQEHRKALGQPEDTSDCITNGMLIGWMLGNFQHFVDHDKVLDEDGTDFEYFTYERWFEEADIDGSWKKGDIAKGFAALKWTVESNTWSAKEEDNQRHGESDWKEGDLNENTYEEIYNEARAEAEARYGDDDSEVDVPPTAIAHSQLHTDYTWFQWKYTIARRYSYARLTGLADNIGGMAELWLYADRPIWYATFDDYGDGLDEQVFKSYFSLSISDPLEQVVGGNLSNMPVVDYRPERPHHEYRGYVIGKSAWLIKWNFTECLP